MSAAVGEFDMQERLNDGPLIPALLVYCAVSVDIPRLFRHGAA